MSESLHITRREGYLSDALCQHFHELIVSIREGTSTNPSSELISLSKQYGRPSKVKILKEVLCDILTSSNLENEMITREFDFLSSYFLSLLQEVDFHSIFQSTFDQIVLRGTVIPYASFLSSLRIDGLSKCVLSIQLVNTSNQPFGDKVNEFLKNNLKFCTVTIDHPLYNIYRTDILSFVIQHKSWWPTEEYSQIVKKFSSSSIPSLSPLSLLFSTPKPQPVYTSLPSSNTLSLLPEVGCILCCSEEVLSTFIHSVYQATSIHFDTQEVASVLLHMATSEVVNDISSQVTLSKDILAYYHVTLPSELFVHCWDAKMVTSVLMKCDPQLDFTSVFAAMDCEEFILPSQASLIFLSQVWETAGMEGSILSLLNHIWKNQEGEVSLVKQLLQAPSSVFTKATQSTLITSNPSYQLPTAFQQWSYTLLLDGILQLLDTSVFDEIKGLLQPIISQQPAYFLLLLLYHPSTSYMKRYLLEQLLLRVLCLSISFDVMEILQKAILPYKQLIVEIIELFLRTNDSIPDAMLININQLNLQESLLASTNHTVFNQLFVKNWSSDVVDSKPLETILRNRIDQFGATVINMMIRFIIAHATDFEKASQSLFSLLRFIEQCEDEYGYIDTNVAMPISEVITSLCSSSKPLQTSWDEYIQLEAGKMVASIQQESTDWDTYCDDIKKLRHSHFTFDSFVYHAFLKQLYTSIQESIERNDTMDTSSLMTLIKALGILIERRILEEEEKATLTEIIQIIDKAASSPLGVFVYQSFMHFIAVCLHDHTDLESQVKSNPSIQTLQRSSSLKQAAVQSSPFTPESARPDTTPTTLRPISTHPSLMHSLSMSDMTTPPRHTYLDAISSDITSSPTLDETKSQFIKRLMNQLGANNVDMIVSRLFTEITPEFYPAFCLLFVEGYVSRQEVFTQIYLEMILSRRNPHLEELCIDACIVTVYNILKEKNDIASHQQLVRIARFLGGLTIGRDHVLPYRKLNLKRLLLNSTKEGRVLPTIMFTCELLSCCRTSSVLKCPSQPWLHSLLVTLWVIHTDTRIQESRSQYIPNLFDVFINNNYEDAINDIKKEAETVLTSSISLSPSLSTSSFTPSRPLSHARSLSGLPPVSTLPPSQPPMLQHSQSMHTTQPPHLTPPLCPTNSLFSSKSASYSPSPSFDNSFEVYMNTQLVRIFKDTGYNPLIKQICREIWNTLKTDIMTLPDKSPLCDFLCQEPTEEVTNAIHQYCKTTAFARADNVNKTLLAFFKQNNIMTDCSEITKCIIQYFRQVLLQHVQERLYNQSNTILNSINDTTVPTPSAWMNQHANLHDHLNQYIRGYINNFRFYFQRCLIQQSSLPKEANLIYDLQTMFTSYPYPSQMEIQSDQRFLFLVDFMRFAFYETAETKDIHLYQIILPTILNVNKNTVNLPIQAVIETALQGMLLKGTPISVSFLGKCLKQQIIQVSFLDNFLTKLLTTSQNMPYETTVIQFVNEIIQKLMIDSDSIFTNKLPSVLRFIADSTQSLPEGSPLLLLKQTVLKLQRKYEVLVQENVYSTHFVSVFKAWYDLCNQSHCSPSEEDTVTFILALKKKGLFVSETQTVVAMRLLFIAALEYKIVNADDFPPARALAILFISFIRYTDLSSKSSVLLCTLTSLSSVLRDNFKSGNTQTNQPTLQILMDLLHYIIEPFLPVLNSSSSTSKNDISLGIDLTRVFLYGLQQLQPEILPSFSYQWITVVSNTSLLQLIKHSQDSILEEEYKNLLLAYLRFLHHFMTLEIIPDSIDCHIKVLTSFLLEIRSIWPAFLSKNYGDFCILIPVRFIQLHNIITSAEPVGIKQFKPNEAINDEMNRCFKQPTQDYWDTSSILAPLELDSVFKQALETNDTSILNELAALSRKHVLSPEYFALLYEIPFALFMKFGFSEKEHTFPVDYFCDLTKYFIKDNLYLPLHDTLLSILDHVRYPSTDTYSYCMLMKTLMKREAKDAVITTICERLLVPGPKSWGLHFLFIQLVNSEKENIKELKCYKTNLAIQNLVEEYLTKK